MKQLSHLPALTAVRQAGRQGETILVVFFSLLLLSVSLFPTFYESLQAKNLPPDRILLWGEHNYTYDYNLYLAKMRQGVEGRWTVLNKVTTEPQKGVFLQMFYLLTGKLGGLIGFSPAITYLLLRIILAAGWLLAGYFFIAQFLETAVARKTAFLLFAFSGSLPRIVKTSQSWQVWNFFAWWQEFDVLKRAIYLPHYLLGHILTVFILILLLKGIRVDKDRVRVKGNLVLVASFLGFLAGMVHPSSLVVVYGIWGLMSAYWVYQMLIHKFNLRYIISYLSSSLFFLVISFVSLYYLKIATTAPAWQGIAQHAQTRWLWSKLDFCLGLGATLFLGIGGLILVLAKRKEPLYPLVAWVLTVPLGMIFFKIVGGPDVSYFFQVAIHLPLAILSVVFLRQLCGKFLPALTAVRQGLLPLTLLALLILLLSLPGIVSSFQGQIRFINERVVATQPLVPYPSQVMYPLKDFWQAIKWLEANTQDEQVVFSEETAGNYISAYAGNFVYLGHNAETVDFAKKKTIVSQFFSQVLPVDQALDLLKENRIEYVFYGPQEKEKGVFDPAKYSFLKPIYESYHVTLFLVSPNLTN